VDVAEDDEVGGVERAGEYARIEEVFDCDVAVAIKAWTD
jgi:hypothetical protein